MKVNPTDIFRLPFKIAESISKPVMDKVDDFLGKDVDAFVEALPGGKMLQNATSSFNRWLLEEPEKKRIDEAADPEAESDVEVEL